MFLHDVSSNLKTVQTVTRLDVKEMINTPINIDGQRIAHPVIVAEIGQLDGILGNDFLSKNKVTIDTSQRILRSPNFKVELQKDKTLSVGCVRIHLTEAAHIYPT